MPPKTRQSKAKEIPMKMVRTKGKGKRKETRPPTSAVPIQAVPSPMATQTESCPVPTSGGPDSADDVRNVPVAPSTTVGDSSATRQGEQNEQFEGEPTHTSVTDAAPPTITVPLQGNLSSESDESGEEQTEGDVSLDPAPPLRSYGRDTRPVVPSVATRKRARDNDDDEYQPPEEPTARQSSLAPRAPPRQKRNVSTSHRGPTVDEIGAHLALEPKFYSLEAKEYFNSVVSKMEVLSEVKFNTNALLAAHWGEYLIKRNLMAWGSIFSECNISLVREMYANLSPSFADSSSVWFGKVFVRGKIISINPSVLCNLLELPVQQFDSIYPENTLFSEASVARTLTQGNKSNFSGRKLNSTSLSLKHFLGFKFCSTCVMPSKNHTYISRDMGNLVYAIEKCVSINFPHIILSQLAARARIANRNKFTLVYPALLTFLLESAGIERCPHDVIENVKSFLLTEKISKKLSDIPVPDIGPSRESLFVKAKRMIKECSEKYAGLAKKQMDLTAAMQTNQEKLDRAFALLPDSWSDDEGERVGQSAVPTSSGDSISDVEYA